MTETISSIAFQVPIIVLLCGLIFALVVVIFAIVKRTHDMALEMNEQLDNIKRKLGAPYSVVNEDGEKQVQYYARKQDLIKTRNEHIESKDRAKRTLRESDEKIKALDKMIYDLEGK